MKERFDKRLADKMRAELEGLDTGYTPGAWEDFARRKWQGGPLIARKWKYFFAGFAGAAALFLFGFFGLSTWWMPADPQLLSSNGGADSLSLASRSFSVSPIRPEPKDIEELDGRASTPSPEPEGASSVAVISAQREVLAQTLPQAAKQTPENTEGTPKPVATTDGLPTLKDLREVTLATTSTATPNWILPPVEKPSSGAGAVVLPNISATSAPREPEQLSVTLAERLENPSEDRAPRAFHIGLLLSPQAVANQSSPLAFGAGIHGGVQIGKRMQVDVGLSLARQEFQPAGPAVEQRVAMATQPASGDRGFAQPNALMRVAVPQGTSLQFAQIEIPINMRYKVLDRREGGFFIAGGVSHMMYANQQATATFAVPNFNAQGVEASSMSETFTNTFSPDTDSGRGNGQFMQLAMGYEQDLGKNTLFMIEPFYKFSLNNQTFLDQAFTLTGVNVRISYQFK